eukprot:3691165-Pyramimonas_sp.AAC.1
MSDAVTAAGPAGFAPGAGAMGCRADGAEADSEPLIWAICACCRGSGEYATGKAFAAGVAASAGQS